MIVQQRIERKLKMLHVWMSIFVILSIAGALVAEILAILGEGTTAAWFGGIGILSVLVCIYISIRIEPIRGQQQFAAQLVNAISRGKQTATNRKPHAGSSIELANKQHHHAQQKS